MYQVEYVDGKYTVTDGNGAVVSRHDTAQDAQDAVDRLHGSAARASGKKPGIRTPQGQALPMGSAYSAPGQAQGSLGLSGMAPSSGMGMAGQGGAPQPGGMGMSGLMNLLRLFGGGA